MIEASCTSREPATCQRVRGRAVELQRDRRRNQLAADEQRITCFGGGYAAPGSHQQALPQIGLQQSDLPAEARLCEVQRHGAAAEAARVDHGHEVEKLPQFHSRSA